MAEAVKKNNGDNGKAATSTVTKQEAQLRLIKRDVVDVVAGKINQFIANGELNLPANYSVNNALKSAWLTLQTTTNKAGVPALQCCTRDSIANSLLDMIVQGLNPSKDQVYFIVYGTILTCQRSYFGSMAVAKEVESKVDDFAYSVVYKGDVFRYSLKNGKKTVVEHEQDIANVKNDSIIAAYCIALDKEGNPFKTDIMTWEEIKQSWRHSKANPVNADGSIKPDTPHGQHPGEFALRTVINRNCKAIINASSDCNLLIERINRNEDIADRAEAEAEIEEEANTGDILDITPEAPQGVLPAEDEPAQQETPETPLQTEQKAQGQQDNRRIPGF